MPADASPDDEAAEISLSGETPIVAESALDELSEDELEAAFTEAMGASEAAVEAAAASVAAATPGTEPNEPAAAATVVKTRPNLAPREIIEAALFVSASPLSVRRLARLLETDDVAGVEGLIVTINADFDRAGRPYEIRHRDDGYQMQLRREYEPTRDRVFGTGSREVTLPPEVVELLALVAYEQPVEPSRIAKLPRKSPRRLVGQLVRRGLVELREEQGAKSYVTTDRFLDVLGLRELDDLPQPQVLSMR